MWIVYFFLVLFYSKTIPYHSTMNTDNLSRQPILIISGKKSFISNIKRTLKKEDVVFDEAVNEDIGTAKAIHFNYSLIIIDRDSSAAKTHLVDIIRGQQIHTPIIIFSNEFSTDQKINYLQKGVDMLIEKSIDPKIIQAQLISFLKKISPGTQNIIQIKDLRLRSIGNEAVYKKKLIALRKKEFDLLAYLASHPNTVFSRSELYRNVWKKNDMRSNTVDSHINQLRKKLGESANSIIKTIHAKGYAMIL